ncbi:MAG: co-chaperone GroES [Patescibacteria group bacterium]|nr:co-chaperone GroES [Patescibacteria group bacterium]
MSTKVTPLSDNVLVKSLVPETKTASGIYIPESATTEKSAQGKVIAIGNSEKIVVRKGQIVMFKKYGGEEITIDNEDYVMVKAEDLIAIVG